MGLVEMGILGQLKHGTPSLSARRLLFLMRLLLEFGGVPCSGVRLGRWFSPFQPLPAPATPPGAPPASTLIAVVQPRRARPEGTFFGCARRIGASEVRPELGSLLRQKSGSSVSARPWSLPSRLAATPPTLRALPGRRVRAAAAVREGRGHGGAAAGPFGRPAICF